MKESEFEIFGGIRFNTKDSFEQVLRPTKWSIRCFLGFMKLLSYSQQIRFTEHTIRFLKENYTDKETVTFVKAITRKTSFNPYTDNVKIVSEGRDNELIKELSILKKRGILNLSAIKLAEIVKYQFGVKYSISTIRDKIYDFISE